MFVSKRLLDFFTCPLLGGPSTRMFFCHYSAFDGKLMVLVGMGNGGIIIIFLDIQVGADKSSGREAREIPTWFEP